MITGSEVTLPLEPFVSVGGGILIAIVTGGFSVLSIWLNKRLNRIDEKTEPTGNGFAKEVRSALRRIEAQQVAHGRDIGGIREEMRSERSERMALARAVSNHIERHDA